MEYSTADIAAARSLQTTKYIHVSMATFWTYDYACSLHEEWSFLLQSRWSKTKGLYIVTRYLPFIIIVTDLYRGFTPNDNADKCRVLDNVESGLNVVLVLFSEWFFILRTYVLWENNRVLLTAMLTTFLSFLGASSGITFATTTPVSYTTSAIPGITGCYKSSTTFRFFIPFLLLFVSELGLLILTLVRAIQNWRTNPNRLYAVLVNHNIFYYACGLLFSVANIFTSLLLYDSVLYDFQFMILALLATRMHLHLWQVNQYAHGSGTLTPHIPMSDLSFVNLTT